MFIFKFSGLFASLQKEEERLRASTHQGTIPLLEKQKQQGPRVPNQESSSDNGDDDDDDDDDDNDIDDDNDDDEEEEEEEEESDEAIKNLGELGGELGVAVTARGSHRAYACSAGLSFPDLLFFTQGHSTMVFSLVCFC